MDDGVVARQLVQTHDADRGPERVGPRPVGGTVDGAAVTQNDRRIGALGSSLELTLHEEDRPLPRPTYRGVLGAREAAAKDDAGRFGQHGDVLAHAVADQLEHGGLSRAGATGEHHPLERVRLAAGAGPHRTTSFPRSMPMPHWNKYSPALAAGRSIETCWPSGSSALLWKSAKTTRSEHAPDSSRRKVRRMGAPASATMRSGV